MFLLIQGGVTAGKAGLHSPCPDPSVRSCGVQSIPTSIPYTSQVSSGLCVWPMYVCMNMTPAHRGSWLRGWEILTSSSIDLRPIYSLRSFIFFMALGYQWTCKQIYRGLQLWVGFVIRCSLSIADGEQKSDGKWRTPLFELRCDHKVLIWSMKQGRKRLLYSENEDNIWSHCFASFGFPHWLYVDLWMQLEEY